MSQTKKFVLSVDVGQANDYTAVVILRSGIIAQREGTKPFEKIVQRRQHDLVHIERFRQIPYPEQIRKIQVLHRELVEHSRTKHRGAPVILTVDATGVGKPILDAFKEAGMRPVGIIITGGETASKGDGVMRIPKRDLATTLQVALQSKRLKIAQELSLARVLKKELLGFKVKISLSGHASFGNDVGEWRRGDAQHDDLVLATAMGVWHLEKRPDMADLKKMRIAMGLEE